MKLFYGKEIEHKSFDTVCLSIKFYLLKDMFRGIRDCKVGVVNLESLARHRCVFEFREETIQPAYGTSVFLLWCLFVLELMHEEEKNLRSSSTSKDGKSPYNLHSVGAT